MKNFVLDNERQLLQRISEGDEIAFRTLVHHYSRLLSPYIIGFTKSREKTEEIVQDIFLRVWLKRKTITEIQHFKTFLFITSRNSALNAVRNMIREERRKQKWQRDAVSLAGTATEADTELPVDLVEEAVRQLPAQQQQVWILSRRQGMKHVDIALQMNISKETVKKYVQYANAAITRYVQSRIELILLLDSNGVLFHITQAIRYPVLEFDRINPPKLAVNERPLKVGQRLTGNFSVLLLH